MMKKLEIEGYRSFKKFEMDNLRRVNLLVGMNNRGKTSVLEALEIVESSSNRYVILNSLKRRGEIIQEDSETSTRYLTDIRRLYHGFELAVGSRFSISTISADESKTFSSVIKRRQDGDNISPDDASSDEEYASDLNQLQMLITWETDSIPSLFPENRKTVSRSGVIYELSPDGGLILPTYVRQAADIKNAVLISTEGFSPERLVRFLERIMLTDDERFVVEALQIIDANIERYATETVQTLPARGVTLSQDRGPIKRGVKLKIKGLDQPIPIGSMGDGVWRLLGLIAGLLNSRNGVFLVDEIDTGLHYSVMKKMWEIVTHIAVKLDIQVFATTHSQDCIDSLAGYISSENSPIDSFSIQRIAPDRSKAISYTENEIVDCAKHGIEVR